MTEWWQTLKKKICFTLINGWISNIDFDETINKLIKNYK